MPLRISDTFLMGGTGGINNPAGKHLMICISMTPDGGAIIVPIVSRHDYSDTSCTLDVGDHPFIKHESCADYSYIRKLGLAAVNADLQNGLMKPQAQVSHQVLIRLQIGLVISDDVEPWAFEAANGEQLKAWLTAKGHM